MALKESLSHTPVTLQVPPSSFLTPELNFSPFPHSYLKPEQSPPREEKVLTVWRSRWAWALRTGHTASMTGNSGRGDGAEGLSMGVPRFPRFPRSGLAAPP